MAQNRHTVYCTRQSRYNGERVKPGQKIEGVTDEELTGLLASGRFTDDPEKAPKPPKEKVAKEEAPKKEEEPKK